MLKFTCHLIYAFKIRFSTIRQLEFIFCSSISGKALPSTLTGDHEMKDFDRRIWWSHETFFMKNTRKERLKNSAVRTVHLYTLSPIPHTFKIRASEQEIRDPAWHSNVPIALNQWPLHFIHHCGCISCYRSYFDTSSISAHTSHTCSHCSPSPPGYWNRYFESRLWIAYFSMFLCAVL
jgi:hypothetical protein